MDNLPADGSSSGTPVTDALESLMKRRPSSPTLPRVTEQEEDNGHDDDEIVEMAELDMNATGGDSSDGETKKPNTPPTQVTLNIADLQSMMASQLSQVTQDLQAQMARQSYEFKLQFWLSC